MKKIDRKKVAGKKERWCLSTIPPMLNKRELELLRSLKLPSISSEEINKRINSLVC